MFALTTTLSLMLVFRLSRAAVRWWDSRMMWGLIIAKVRQISCRGEPYTPAFAPQLTANNPSTRRFAPRPVVGFNVKGTEAARLQVLMDLVVFSVAARCYLRSNPILPSDLSGVAGPETIEQLNSCDHMVLKAGMILTKRLVGLHEGNPSGPQLNVALEGKLKLVDDLVQTAGGLERIKVRRVTGAMQFLVKG
jgi:predicted membrane chloride channel (bestrophin family)